MNNKAYPGNGPKRNKSGIIHLVGLIGCLALLILALVNTPTEAKWPEIAISKDGTPISYEVFGKGEPTLVFVHGWNCDARYWRAQIPVFSRKHRIIVLDLAGHGHSGMERTDYTMTSYGEDVRAVMEAAGSSKAILIGHSMGGSVIAEAARLMPDRIIGLIGVDTLENIEYQMTSEELEKMIAPMKNDFQNGSRQFVRDMIADKTDPKLREWILSDMSSAPPAVALSAITEMMSLYISGEAAKVFEKIKIPVITVNGDLWPIYYKANRRHMFYFDAIVLKDADHFLMMNQAEVFNQALGKAIRKLTDKQLKKAPNRTVQENKE